jgi:hypothetical protein
MSTTCIKCRKRDGKHRCVDCNKVFDTEEECKAHQVEAKHVGGHYVFASPKDRVGRAQNKRYDYDDLPDLVAEDDAADIAADLAAGDAVLSDDDDEEEEDQAVVAEAGEVEVEVEGVGGGEEDVVDDAIDADSELPPHQRHKAAKAKPKTWFEQLSAEKPCLTFSADGLLYSCTCFAKGLDLDDPSTYKTTGGNRSNPSKHEKTVACRKARGVSFRAVSIIQPLIRAAWATSGSSCQDKAPISVASA